MPLTEDEERAEYELRMDMMSAQLEQAKVNIDKMRLEMKTDNRKFLVQLLSGTAAAMAAGAAILGLILHLTGKL